MFYAAAFEIGFWYGEGAPIKPPLGIFDVLPLNRS